MPYINKSRFTVELPVQGQGDDYVALYQTMTGGFVLIPARTWSYVLSDPIAPADPGTLDMLFEQGFLIKEGVNETHLFDNWMQQHVHDFSTLKSTVLVTRKCNNRCTYCILDPEAKDMSPKTAQAMDRFYIGLMNEKRPNRVEDSFVGGEPLLNAGIILETATRRSYFCQGRGIEYGFSIVTNGTLISESVIMDMKAVGLRDLRVSIAGPAPVHDLLRPSKNGGKTYDLILRNLQAITELVPISIECQYDSSARDFLSIPRMLDDMARRGILIENIAFTPILPRRGECRYDSGMGDPRVYLHLKAEAEKRDYLVDNGAPPTHACSADFRSHFVFDTDGSIIPCPSLQGSEMAYGDVFRGIDFVSESQLLKRSLSKRCLEKCELLPICMGGCRLQALVNENGFNGIDCHYDAQRLFLEEYIRACASANVFSQKEVDLKKAA